MISQANLHQLPDMLGWLETTPWKVNVDLFRWKSEKNQEVDALKLQDMQTLSSVLKRAKESPAVITPDWIIDGYIPFLENRHPKHCPYLDSPTIGSKFFVEPSGEMTLCENYKIGNLIEHSPDEIFQSEQWKQAVAFFKECPGCWNTCFTLGSRVSNYLRYGGLKSIWGVIRNYA